jgi:Ala-tRNA(Pro) deacylase
MKDKLREIQQLYQYLQSIQVSVKTITHPEVVSCEESKKHYDMLGYDEEQYGLCKNIFIRDKKGKNFWLVIIDYRKKIDMEELREVLGTKRLGFATSDDLSRILGVQSGSVSLFSVINDRDSKVKVVIDEDLMRKPSLAFHPNYSGLTSFISARDALRFLMSMDNEYAILDVPSKESIIEEESMVKRLAYNS